METIDDSIFRIVLKKKGYAKEDVTMYLNLVHKYNGLQIIHDNYIDGECNSFIMLQSSRYLDNLSRDMEKIRDALPDNVIKIAFNP